MKKLIITPQGEQLVDLTQAELNQIQIEHMCSTSNNYITSLLASVEIWAKLFIEKKSINEVEQMVIQYAKMK